jgi:hypothetical protein
MSKYVHSEAQRLIIYKVALKYYIDNPDITIGICASLKQAQHFLNVKFYVCPYRKISQFPEIAKHQPKVILPNGYWFLPSNREKRIEIFNSAIKELEK